MKRLISLTVLVALLSLALAGCGGDDDGDTTVVPTTAAAPAAPTTTPATTSAPPPPPTTGAVEDMTKISVVNEDPGGTGKYAFNPSDLSFSVGEKVEFTLLGETEFHTFTVDDLGIDESLGAGEEVVFTYTFDKAGSFDLICLSHPQMTGTITVK